MAAEIQHNEVIDHEDVSVDYGCFNPEFAGLQYDLGIDLGITRKQVETNDVSVNSMDSSEYHALMRTLNCKQRSSSIISCTKWKQTICHFTLS